MITITVEKGKVTGVASDDDTALVEGTDFVVTYDEDEGQGKQSSPSAPEAPANSPATA